MINKNSRIAITGAYGFLGRHVCKTLEDNGYKDVIRVGRAKPDNEPTFNIKDCFVDLCSPYNVDQLLFNYNPHAIIHLAAKCGGIGANKDNPGVFFFDNMKMGMNLIDGARHLKKLQKFILIGTVCSYPKYTEVPFKEADLWDGYPEETNAPYGIAKKALMEMVRAYDDQYDFPGISLLIVNMYGPGDDFNPNTSHVIPALIKKFIEAKEKGLKEVTIWGTGEASREFLYVTDAALAIMKTMEWPGIFESPMNIGTGQEIKIRDLVKKIASMMKYDGEILFDTSKPDGQPRRCLDTTYAKAVLGFVATTSLDDGLKQTIEWYTHDN